MFTSFSLVKYSAWPQAVIFHTPSQAPCQHYCYTAYPHHVLTASSAAASCISRLYALHPRSTEMRTRHVSIAINKDPTKRLLPLGYAIFLAFTSPSQVLWSTSQNMAKCYDLSGSLLDNPDIPCSSTGSPAQCCQITDERASNGLCISSEKLFTPYFINSCTLLDWDSASTCLTQYRNCTSRRQLANLLAK